MDKWDKFLIVAFLQLGISLHGFSREFDPYSSVSGNSEQNKVKSNSSSSQVKSNNRIEKTWVDIKAKAENLWSSYFGERPTKNDGLAAIPKLNQPPGSTKSQAETASSKDKNPEGSGSQVSKQDSLNQQNNLVEEAKKNLPDYKVSDKGFSREEIRSAKEKLKNQVPILTVNPGRKGTSELPLSKGGAPKFDFFESTKVKNNKGKVRNVKIRKKSIPLLDIGEEAVISAQDLSDLTFTVKKPDYSLANPLKHTPFYNSAEVSKWKTKKLILLGAFDDKGLRKGLVKGYPVTKEMVAKIDISEIADVAVSELMVKHLSKDEQALLTALIVNRKGGECPLVIGLLDDLRKKKTLADEASFHLGVCAQKMKLYSQAFSRLTKVIIAEDPQLAPEAIALLASDLPVEYEVKLTQILSGVKNKALIPIQSQDDVNYVMGKGYFKLGKYDLAVKHAQEVGEKSQKYIQAKYLLGISEYASKKGKAGIKTLMSLREWMSKKAKGDKNVSSLMAINIARILFNIGQYKESLEEYKKIGKDHSVWLQGLIEQGWAQVLTGDSSGAIGNMHSLHSPYFKAVYKPESYVVRTIGYLNICQYGDAYKSLARMEQEHTPWVKSMDAYLAKKHSPEEYYDTVKNYLRSPSTEIVDGLPFQIVREMGRSRDFLNYQSAINEKVDEGDRYPGILVEFNKGVKEIQVRLGRAKARYKATVMNLKKAKKDKSLQKSVNEWLAQRKNDLDLIVGYNFLLKMLGESKSKLAVLKASAISDLNKEKRSLRLLAGKSIGTRIAEMRSEVKKYIENNELLRYEIFAGAGENIRYQVAGGATQEANRIPANVKPAKILNWEFDGEYWEDEIGNYRSQAKDNCPQKGKIAGPGARIPGR